VRPAHRPIGARFIHKDQSFPVYRRDPP
jgi:hypothetical protein